MRRLLACFLVMLALGVLDAAPARPLYEAPETPAPASLLDLGGTTWRGHDHTQNSQICFEADGTVSYGDRGRPHRGGTWTLQGNRLYFQINGKYREFRGTVVGDILQGDSWNIAGDRWKTNLHRVRP